jgi:DNA repair exonuclease SbcCD ATPase subunit
MRKKENIIIKFVNQEIKIKNVREVTNMNIKFEELDIEGFRSIDRISLNLSDQGIVIVKGINNYEDLASSNGSGKSSVFEAIIYALFEETSSGDRDIENRILGQGCSVVLKFSIDDVSYKIIRQSKKGKGTVVLYRNDEDISARNKSDTNKLIVSILGINKAIFLDSIFLSQNAVTNLPSLSPTARKERLEILTNTDNAINNFKTFLKEKQTMYESKHVDCQLEINKINGKEESLQQQKDKLQAQINDIKIQIEERNKLGNIEDLDKQIQEYNVEINTINNQIPEIDNKITIINNSIKELNVEQGINETLKHDKDLEIQDQRNICNNIQNEITRVTNVIGHNKIDIDRINKEIEEIKNSDTCPTCGRKYDNVNEEHIQKVIEEKNKEIKDLEDKNLENSEYVQNKQTELDKEIEKGKKLREEFEKLSEVYKDKNNEIEEQQTNLLNTNNKKTQLLNSIQNIQVQIDVINKQKDDILKIEIPNSKQYEDMVQDIDTQLNNLNKLKEDKNNELYELDNYINAIKHCIQLVTKDFRTFLLKNSLSYLNKILKDYSSQLFSNESDLIYISENDNKLDIMLGNATYESLSGGEKTRVNIALLIAQKSLANMIGNISCNIIILDEILGYCDALAENNVINLITKELESLETIYMISHKEIPIGYDAELIVEKNANGLTHLKSY